MRVFKVIEKALVMDVSCMADFVEAEVSAGGLAPSGQRQEMGGSRSGAMP